jgi:hypothetical protein
MGLENTLESGFLDTSYQLLISRFLILPKCFKLAVMTPHLWLIAIAAMAISKSSIGFPRRSRFALISP